MCWRFFFHPTVPITFFLQKYIICNLCIYGFLENIIKTRLVLDNGKKDENGEEKLSTEFYNYGKEEIKRINKKHGHGGHKKKEKEDDLAEIEGDLLKEIKELMKD